MDKRAIATAITCLWLFASYSQTIQGGAGICNVTGDPDNITAMQTQDERGDCLFAWDENNQTLYVYDGSLSLGSRWNEYTGTGDNLGNHIATQNLDMDDNAITDADRISGGIGPGPTPNVGEIDFNEPVGSGVTGNAMTFEHNASVMITSDRNGNAVSSADEPIILSQGNINTDDPDYTELLRTYDNKFRIMDAYDMAVTAPPVDGDDYVQAWVNGINVWRNYSDAGLNTSLTLNGTDLEIVDDGGTLTADLSSLAGGGILEIENTNTVASNNTTNNYHEGNFGIGDFSSNTIGATFHLYDPAMTMRLSDECATDQCATPQLDFYRGYNTSQLGRVGFLSSLDNDFSFINNLATGKLKFGTDATVKLELLASGQARLNQYTSSSSFSGTVAGYLAFDSNGYLITDSGSGGGGTTTFTGLTDTPGSYSGQAGKFLRVNTGETGLEYTTSGGGGDVSHYTLTTPSTANLTIDVNWNEQNAGFFKLDLSARSRWEINDTLPQTSVVPNYNVLFTNVATDTVTFPSTFLYADGSQIGSIQLSGDLIQEFWYDGTNYWTHPSMGTSVTAPTCSDGIQNGDETGVDCGGSCPDACSGGSYITEYQAIIDHATTQGYTLPSVSQRDDQEQLVQDLITAGMWDSLDVFYVTATDGDRDFAKINWKDPGTYDLEEVGTLTFTANQGFKSNGTNGYLNTGLNLNTDSTSINYGAQYGQIAAHLNTNDINWPQATALCGAREASSSTTDQILIQNNANNQYIVRMQSYGNTVGSYEYLLVTNPGGYTGHFYFNRSSTSTLQYIWDNGFGATDTSSDNFPDLPNEELYILALNTAGSASNYNQAELSMFMLGTWASNRNAVYNAWNDYATILGID